jgi:hypothetical protein
MKLTRMLSVASVVLLVAVTGCSDDDKSSNCQAAADVGKKCDAQQSTADAGGGSSITVTSKFDVQKCEESDQGKKIADCIVQNQDKCDCQIKCALTGGTC